MEIKNAQFFHPEKPNEKFDGRVFREDGKCLLELYNYSSYLKTTFKPFVDILFVIDLETNAKYTAVNLSIKSWNAGGRSIFKINEFYEGSWINSIFENDYTRCTVQMSGLAIWMKTSLIKFSYEENSHVFKVQDDEEKSFTLKDKTIVTFRKYSHWQIDTLALNVNEKATLILECIKSQNRQRLFSLVQSFRYMLNICVPSTAKIWEINFQNSKEACSLKLYEYGTDELLNQSGVLLHLEDFSERALNKWIDHQKILNEISSLLTEARENIVAETSFTYCAKALELIYKYLFPPVSEEFLNTVKQEMKNNKIWESKWDKNKLTVTSSKSNFRVMLCCLWQIFNPKGGIETSIAQPYNFLAKVHRSRNYYTHLDGGSDIFKPSQLYIVNKILIAFCYGLILQYLGLSNDKILKFTKAYTGFWFGVEYDSNPYSINFKEKK